MPSAVVSEMLIMRGTKKRPVAGQTIDTFFTSLMHLRLNGLKLTGDVAAITPCKQLRMLYVYADIARRPRRPGAADALIRARQPDREPG